MTYNAQAPSEEDKRLKRMNLEREQVILKSDRNTLERKLEAMEMDLRMLLG